MKKNIFKANRGGHAPGHLREAFWLYVEDLESGKEIDDKEFLSKDIQEIFWDEKKRTVGWLLGQLWNCTDIMPSEGCLELELPQGSTYARAARLIKSHKL